MAAKRFGLVAVVSATIMSGFGLEVAHALPASSLGDAATAGRSLAIERVQSRIGYWRKRQEQADMKRSRGKPGAQRVLRQQRQNLCRNVPEMC